MQYLWSMVEGKSGMSLIRELQYLSALTRALGFKISKTALVIPSERVVVYLPAQLISMHRVLGAIQDELKKSHLPVIYRNWPDRRPGMPVLRSALEAV